MRERVNKKMISLGSNACLRSEVRILTSFGAGDLGTEVDFLYSVMWVTKVTFQTILRTFSYLYTYLSELFHFPLQAIKTK